MSRYDRFEFLGVARRDGIATVTLNRPDKDNAIDRAGHRELEDVWPLLADDAEVRAIVLTGAGKAFSTGGDIEAMAARAGTPKAVTHSIGLAASTRRLFTNILDTPQPIIAAVNGHATGLGATLALFADIVVIAEQAKFGDTHVNVGLVAGDGGAVIWPLLIGPARAKELLMTARLLRGTEVQAMGLAGHVAPADDVLPRALELAQELAAKAPLAVQWTKLSVNRGIRAQLDIVLDSSIALEMVTMASADHAEATAAFLEKRSPKFEGR
ncbi:enoyl-CoA hydratase/isomerase family protein [Sphingosinicella terrae]|uniref:enoyl-CoA hydratase/isomerase family protein n=1 Tax=Sphingosinicella terrae TaxID=2172047 RepID=UPI000E0CDC3E|nr:enoyl-CoA hydratase-related protein [Sphingosinicella terrae]